MAGGLIPGTGDVYQVEAEVVYFPNTEIYWSQFEYIDMAANYDWFNNVYNAIHSSHTGYFNCVYNASVAGSDTGHFNCIYGTIPAGSDTGHFNCVYGAISAGSATGYFNCVYGAASAVSSDTGVSSVTGTFILHTYKPFAPRRLPFIHRPCVPLYPYPTSNINC